MRLSNGLIKKITVGLTFFLSSPSVLLAQSYDPEKGDLEDYLAERTVLIKMSCLPQVEAGAGVDTGLIPVEPRVRWGSGVFIRNDGYVVTAHHTLSEIVKERDERLGATQYRTSCDPDQVNIDFYRTEHLGNAANDAAPTFEEDDISTRNEVRSVADVMFLKANTFGRNNLPYLCAHALYQTNETLEDLEVSTTQIEIQAGGQFRLKFREGRASSNRGAGQASNFHIMTIPAQPGASGAAVVDKDGQIVGIVHGYSEMINPNGNEDYLVPYRLFNEDFGDYSEECMNINSNDQNSDTTDRYEPPPISKVVVIDNKEYNRGYPNSTLIRDILYDHVTSPLEVKLERSGSQWSEVQRIEADTDLVIMHWSAFEESAEGFEIGYEECNLSMSMQENSCNRYFIRILNELSRRLSPESKFIVYSRTENLCSYADAIAGAISSQTALQNERFVLFDVSAAGRDGSFQDRDTKIDLGVLASHMLDGSPLPIAGSSGVAVPGAMEGVCIPS